MLLRTGVSAGPLIVIVPVFTQLMPLTLRIRLFLVSVKMISPPWLTTIPTVCGDEICGGEDLLISGSGARLTCPPAAMPPSPAKPGVDPASVAANPPAGAIWTIRWEPEVEEAG